MKLVKFKEFLAYPVGTVYMVADTDYPLEMNASLCVKQGNFHNKEEQAIDFCYHEVLAVDTFDKSGDNIYGTLIHQVEDDMSKKQVTRGFSLDRESYKREGLFDENSWYMVFDKQEVKHLISTLQEAVIMS